MHRWRFENRQLHVRHADTPALQQTPPFVMGAWTSRPAGEGASGQSEPPDWTTWWMERVWTAWPYTTASWDGDDSHLITSVKSERARETQLLTYWNSAAAAWHLVLGVLGLGLGLGLHKLEPYGSIPVHVDLPPVGRGYQVVGHLQPALLAATALLFAGAYHLSCAIPAPWHEAYRTNVVGRKVLPTGNRRNPQRWIEYSITTPIMILEIGLLTGISDFFVLLNMCSLAFMTAACGYLTDPERGKPRKRVAAFWVGAGAWLVVWLTLFIYLGQTWNVDGRGTPWFVPTIFLTQFLLQAGTGLVQLGELHNWWRAAAEWHAWYYGDRVTDADVSQRFWTQTPPEGIGRIQYRYAMGTEVAHIVVSALAKGTLGILTYAAVLRA